MKILATVVITILVLAAISFGYMYSGSYDFAASQTHRNITLRILNTAVTQSVKRHARGITPPDLSNPSLVKAGSRHFQGMCVQCHGGPGVSRTEAGEDLYPKGPDLTKVAQHWTPQELYWITKYGIKMTGMPAWGLTSEDDELWALVAFMKQLPSISPEQYEQMLEEAKAERGGHEEHGHRK